MGASAIERAIPGIAMLRSYRPRWLGKDLTAGLVLSALLVPQGMAYAELAGLPAITGLYTTILCLLGYAVFGPSKVLVLGPDSSLGPMIAATIATAAARLRYFLIIQSPHAPGLVGTVAITTDRQYWLLRSL